MVSDGNVRPTTWTYIGIATRRTTFTPTGLFCAGRPFNSSTTTPPTWSPGGALEGIDSWNVSMTSLPRGTVRRVIPIVVHKPTAVLCIWARCSNP